MIAFLVGVLVGMVWAYLIVTAWSRDKGRNNQ